MTDIIALLEQACGGRCNAENNPCEYKEAALELEGLKPVAWVKQDVCEDQFVEGRVRRVWWECNTGVGQPLYTTPVKQKPVAWRKKVSGVWHYFDELTPFPFDDCEPLYEKN